MKTASRILGAVLLLAAIAAALAGYHIATTAAGRGPVRLEGDPMETVEEFFDDLCEEDYGDAYECLYGYDTLGLENTPEEPEAAAIWNLIRENTTWSPVSGYTVAGTDATCQVVLTMPDITALTENLGDAVAAQITARSTGTTEEIYDDAGNLKREFALEIYAEVLEERLEQEELPTCSTTVTVSLTYTDTAWKIVPDEALLSALSGVQ